MIEIKDFKFVPAVLNIKLGETVVWINQDDEYHTVKSSILDSPNLDKGDKFEHTFMDKGTFEYTCSIHPMMIGQVIVE